MTPQASSPRAARQLRHTATTWLPTVVMGMAAVMVMVVCVWTGTQWRTVHEALVQHTERLHRARQIIAQEHVLTERREAYAPFLTISPSDDAGLRDLLQRIERAAAHATVQITGLKPRPTQRGEHQIEYRVELECVGSVTALTQFVHGVEYSDALVRIDQLRISPAPRSDDLLQSQLLLIYTQIL